MDIESNPARGARYIDIELANNDKLSDGHPNPAGYIAIAHQVVHSLATSML